MSSISYTYVNCTFVHQLFHCISVKVWSFTLIWISDNKISLYILLYFTLNIALHNESSESRHLCGHIPGFIVKIIRIESAGLIYGRFLSYLFKRARCRNTYLIRETDLDRKICYKSGGCPVVRPSFSRSPRHSLTYESSNDLRYIVQRGCWKRALNPSI